MRVIKVKYHRICRSQGSDPRHQGGSVHVTSIHALERVSELPDPEDPVGCLGPKRQYAQLMFEGKRQHDIGLIENVILQTTTDMPSWIATAET